MGLVIAWTSEEDRKLIDLAGQNLNARQIAQEIGRSREGVTQRARKLNVNLRGHGTYISEFTFVSDGEWEALNKRGCAELLAALQKFHPGGAAYVIEKPTKGGPRRYTPEPRLMYRSSAAACAEG